MLYNNDHRFMHESGYLWLVRVAAASNADGYQGYYYLIDADSGRVVGNDRDPDFSGTP